MAHRIIIMRDKEEDGGGAAAARHQQILEEAATQLATVGPRLFRQVKSHVMRRGHIPEHIRDLGDSQMWVLHALAKGKNLTSELARHHNVTTPTMSRIVDGLVDKGYVQRRHAAEDRRCIFLQLTDEGKELGQDIQQIFLQAMLDFLAPLSEDQLADIIRAYRHLAALLNDGGAESEHQLIERVAAARSSAG
jgi:DNA-binding MarR family transcriptional regulator